LRVVLEPERGEFERVEFLLVEEVDDAAAVDGVSCQSVGMPGDDAGGFAGFDAAEHFVENGSAGAFGGFALDEFLLDAESFTARICQKLGSLPWY